jgi:hypothetical protein
MHREGNAMNMLICLFISIAISPVAKKEGGRANKNAHSIL